MGKYNIIDEITKRVIAGETPDMSLNSREQLRVNMTNTVLEERALKAGLDPIAVKAMWRESQRHGKAFDEIEAKLIKGV